jgi:signal transduction histidine kinase/GAF domain-containing protein/ActR/RegA family two-component response regulator
VVYGILDACLVRDHRGQPAYCLGSVVDISKRKQTEQALRRRLAYEHLVAEITASVVRVNDIAQFQEECVAELGKTIGVSRVYIFEHHAAQNTMSNTHEWCGAGITPQKVTLQDVPGDAAQWWIETLKRDEIICYADIEQIPDEATKAILRPQNIQSVLVVPIFVGGKYYGFLGFDECAEQRQWPAEDIEILKSITQILSAAIMRARVEQALVRRRNELETLYQGARDVLTGSEFETIARRIFAGAQKITGAQSGYVALLSASGAENELLFLESGGLPCTVDPNLPMPIRGLRAEAYASGEVVWENDFSNSRWAEYMPDGHVALRNVLFAPLRIGEQTVGVIGLANKPTDFDENDRNIAAAMGQLAALGLQRWRAEEATRAERDRLQGVMQTVPVAIMIADDRQCIIQTNRAAAQIFGRSDLSTAKCARCGDIIACAHRKDVNKGCGYAKRCASCEVYRAIKDGLAGKTIDGLETEIEIRRQGKTTRRQILLSAAPLRIGNQAGVILAAKDITEIRKLHAKIAQADRLSSMGMLAAGVAHEINNPLAYTLYNLESLTEDLPPLLEDLRDLHVRLSSPDPVTTKEAQDLAQTLKPSTLTDIHSRLKETLEGTHRIRDITHGLSTFSRVERDTLVPVDLAHVIDVAVNMAFNEIKYRARLIKDYGRTPPILASEGRLSQVFLNLFINASHAIEVGDVEHNEIRIHTWSNDAFVYAEVRDSGSGIAPENLDRLFEPFFSTKAIGKGSGLGLSISKNIVEGYGGTISVESELGSGTRFLVALPIRKQIVPPKKKQPAATAQVTTGRVLLVDDEPAIRKTMARMLREHETVQAANGTEARKILEQDSAFDLILCDMMMPDFSGMDLHQWLIQTHPRLAKNFIFITGGAFTPHARQYLSEVENLRLKKPFDVKNFRKIVSDQIIIAKRKKVSGTSD